MLNNCRMLRTITRIQIFLANKRTKLNNKQQKLQRKTFNREKIWYSEQTLIKIKMNTLSDKLMIIRIQFKKRMNNKEIQTKKANQHQQNIVKAQKKRPRAPTLLRIIRLSAYRITSTKMEIAMIVHSGLIFSTPLKDKSINKKPQKQRTPKFKANQCHS